MKTLSMTAILAALVTFGSLFVGCSSMPRPGEPEYIREQVYQCRVLCTNSEVSITKIQGLDCVCNKAQPQNMIFSPIINNNVSGGSSAAPASAPQVFALPTQPVSIPYELTPTGKGVTIKDNTGRSITSQVKE